MRTIEVFSANCPVCKDVVDQVMEMACPSCNVIVLDLNETEAAQRASELRVNSVPAVAINGELADCCTGRGVDADTLRAAGVGQPE